MTYSLNTFYNYKVAKGIKKKEKAKAKVLA
jgi:hypothetical protein